MGTQTMTSKTVWQTELPLPLLNRGKVRDIYAVGEDKLLIVTTDRLSAFDVVLPNPIPDKGRVLNKISLFWFEKFKSLVPNHILADKLSDMKLGSQIEKTHGALLEGRSILVKRANPLPIECVVRGFLSGSGWKDYLKTGAVCGHKLPAGLRQSQRLPNPLFTPATKATVGHDMNIDFAEAARLVGDKIAAKARDLSIRIYNEGVEFAKTRGIIIADTKFEFGLIGGELVLIDEVLTPDSSRFWPAATYEAGKDQPSLDKQIVRNHLLASGWNQTPPGPELPEAIIQKTSEAYRNVYTQLTSQSL